MLGDHLIEQTTLRVYVGESDGFVVTSYLGEDVLFVDRDTCVSCEIPTYLLGLAPRNAFTDIAFYLAV